MKLSLSWCVVVAAIALWSSAVAQCPAGYECMSDCQQWNATDVVVACHLGYVCRNGSEPRRCPPGYYCPDTSGEPVECPSGYFCPEASWQPRECPGLSSCGGKQYRYFYYGWFIYLIIVGLYIAAVHFGYHYRHLIFATLLGDKSGLGRVNSTTEATKSHDSSDEKRGVLDIKFEDLEVTLKPGNCISRHFAVKKTILSGATGEFKHGRVAAIMGPSGAGKTTLMNVLLGKIQKTSGTILVNGREQKIEKYARSIGFVPQEDVMIRSLTVRDILEHSAMTRLPASTTIQERKRRVDEVISVLGLSHVQHSTIGDELKRGISGGERKRVNIGIEMVTDPVALFLDEPTSGLDSSSSKDVMKYLQKISRTGITVVTVLHQPRSDTFQLCDDLVLLGRGGKTVYSGPADQAISYFKEVGFTCPQLANPADFYLDVISGHVKRSGHSTFKSNELFALWEARKQILLSKDDGASSSSSSSATPPKRQTPNIAWQFIMCLKRAVLMSLIGTKLRVIDVLIHVIAGVLVGLGFFAEPIFIPPVPREYVPYCPLSVREAFCIPAERSTIQRMMIYSSMALGLATVVIGIRSFFNERVNYWREASSGTNRVAYFLAKNVADFEGMVIHSWIFLSSFFIVASPAGDFAKFYPVVLLYEFCIYGVGYVVTWISPSNPYLFGVIVALLSGLGTGGSGQTVERMGFAGSICWARYFGEAWFITEVTEDKILESDRPAVREFADTACGFDLDNYTYCIGCLIILGVALRVLAFLCMIGTNRDKQK